MTGKTIGWHYDDVAEPSRLSLHDDVSMELMVALRRISTWLNSAGKYELVKVFLFVPRTVKIDDQPNLCQTLILTRSQLLSSANSSQYEACQQDVVQQFNRPLVLLPTCWQHVCVVELGTKRNKCIKDCETVTVSSSFITPILATQCSY